MSNEQTLQLVNEVATLLKRYTRFTDDYQPLALALWVLNTYVYGAWDIVPYVNIYSATAGSGKTHLLRNLGNVVNRPELMFAASPMLLPRLIEREHPTVLYDEQSAASPESRAAIRGILNGGSERGIPYRVNVPTKDGGWEPQKFDVYCPKAFAGIGAETLADDTRSRCIPIELRKALPDERPERFRGSRIYEQTKQLRQALAKWGEAVRPTISDAEPDTPAELDGRQQDIWEPLLAIADLAGVGEPARTAAVRLHQVAVEDDTSPVTLLAHLSELFETDVDIICSDDGGGIRRRFATSADLLIKLTSREDWPWLLVFERPRGSAEDKLAILKVNGKRLSGMLKPFGIERERRQLRGMKNPIRGYSYAAFEDAWRRYLPSVDGSRTVDGSKNNALTRASAMLPSLPSNPGMGPTPQEGDDVNALIHTQTPPQQSLNVWCSNGHGATLRPEQLAAARCSLCGQPFAIPGVAA